MIVVDELAAEFKIKPPVFLSAATNLLGLLLEILIVVKTKFHGYSYFP